MKTFVPSYFKKFKCIAGACPDSCCIGWEADLDGEILKKYKTIGGELGERIKNALAKDETDCDIFALCKNGRCPFLNSKNLCDIQAAHGEEYLSKTCAMFPRFFDSFGNRTEMGLGFGCPEAARIMLEDDEPFSLEMYEESIDKTDDINEDYLKEIINLRTEIFAILENSDLSFKCKIESVFGIVTTFQEDLDGNGYIDEFHQSEFDDCIAILENMEYIKPKRKSFISSLKGRMLPNTAVNLYRSDFEKLMKYYIFRYFLTLGYEYDVITPVKYGVFACIVISRIYAHLGTPDFETRVKIMYSYSKEVEYSDLNITILDNAMYTNFSVQDLINMI